MKYIIASIILTLSGTVSATCIGNNTSNNVRVQFSEDLHAQGGSIHLSNIAFKEILSPKQEVCFPDNHTYYKKARWLSFMAVPNMNHPSRQQGPSTLYYLTKPLPDFASVVVKSTGMPARISVYVDGKRFTPGPVRKADISEQD